MGAIVYEPTRKPDVVTAEDTERWWWIKERVYANCDFSVGSGSRMREFRSLTPGSLEYRPSGVNEWLPYIKPNYELGSLCAAGLKYNQHGEPMLPELKKSLQSFIQAHGNTIFLITVVVLLDHYLFEGALRDRLKRSAEGLLDRLPGGPVT